MQGKADTPEILKQFFTILDTGESSEVSRRKQRLIDSSAADCVYSSSGGKLLPGKHLSLELALKSMTGSKTVTNVVNRFGHCVSSDKARQIDIGMESTITLTTKLRPRNIRRDPNSCLGLAWDNFGINQETLSGAGSIHHITEYAIKITHMIYIRLQ